MHDHGTEGLTHLDALAELICQKFEGTETLPEDGMCADPERHAGLAWRTRSGRYVCGLCHPASSVLIGDRGSYE